MSISGGASSANTNDTLKGEAGNDTLVASAGDNTLDGGTGADTITTGNGSDTVVFEQEMAATHYLTLTSSLTSQMGVMFLA